MRAIALTKRLLGESSVVVIKLLPGIVGVRKFASLNVSVSDLNKE